MQPGIVKAVTGVVHVDAARGRAQVDAIASFIDDVASHGTTDGPIHGEVFKFGNPSVEGALLRAMEGGTPVSIVADSGVGVPRLHDLAAAGATVVKYGASAHRDAAAGADLCMHAKLWSRGDHALLPTASAADAGSRQLNLNLRFSGDSARAARSASAAAMTNERSDVRDALERAREHGVLFNDPTIPVRHLDDAMGALVDHADHRLELVIKEFTVDAWAERLAAAQARGVDVDVTTRMMTRSVRRILEDAGVHETTVPFSRTPGLRELLGQRLHFNAVFADVPTAAELRAGASIDGAHAVVGTRYLWEPTKPGERLARENGVALAGTNALDARRAVAAHVGLSHLGVLRASMRANA